jgi:hypothetical protein
MKEIRDIKIDLLMGNQNPIVDLFREITKDLQIINCDVYNKDGMEFIYFVPTKNEWIFYQDCKKDEFWCNYTKYWSLFESNLRLEYQEIGAITKLLVEEALKREVTTPRNHFTSKRSKVEEALKREVNTPNHPQYISSWLVEETLKREVTTPVSNTTTPTPHNSSPRVEETLKREVGTSFPLRCKLASKVEEALKLEVDTPVKHKATLVDGVEEALERTLIQTKI